ncbi:MAG: hypothetical protein COV74_07330 [Candidatus Omnitrophica bacterium CG11_big_fil_rev_8_21_14_0_20_45_26]|uniref:Oxidoreductase n=1 Tax=Candidatus Abzuiibacterium crystallinum TaxID=1974748 RepID=A0A2H0LN09_9BACT|nr:MAG: hypothetical protein COV74_07330 [Candidatus Omnitrophica bacterium CG11_big_fil_rev_8_21_14_0_20_45_26]PIW65510.1 MAG: hypothetical protein COW12_01585 [Candidatus Omnitrophica bacterium CG12_big_fil_rev_8_21_14_0_65_45_16]
MPTAKSNQWALVTGASSGIGEAFAYRFAREGRSVILVARSKEKLHTLAKVIQERYHVQTLVIASDLSQTGAPQDVYDFVKSNAIEVDCLINNAGFGAVTEVMEIDLKRQLEMIDLNVKSLVALSYLFLKEMKKNQRGCIMNVSSTASFQSMPYFTTYAATKAFVTSFTEGLWYECRGTGVRIVNLCPGRTKTNFGAAAGQPKNIKDSRPTQTAEEVAEYGWRAFMSADWATVITNPVDGFMCWFARFLPRKISVVLIGGMAQRMGYRQ